MMWTQKWPTKPGWYWMYGKRFKNSLDKPELCAVEFWTTSNDVCGVDRAGFVYQEEVGPVLFVPMSVP